MANEKFEERHIICEVRSKSLDSSRESSRRFVRLRRAAEIAAALTECYYISIPPSRLWSRLRLLWRSRAVVIARAKLCASVCQLW
jgi:hypothetical protein